MTILSNKLAQLSAQGVSLGTPLFDENFVPDVIRRGNSDWQVYPFSGGAVCLRSVRGALPRGESLTPTIWGAIYQKWLLLGGTKASNPVGMPVTDELTTPDGTGRFNHCQSGSIYWTPRTGANAVWGAIRALWSQMGWERSVLGYPKTDETATPKPKDYGRYNHFEHGSIYWTQKTGAHFIASDIFTEWAKQGHEREKMGFPVPREWGKATESLRKGIADKDVTLFEGGYIYREGTGRVISVLYEDVLVSK